VPDFLPTDILADGRAREHGPVPSGAAGGEARMNGRSGSAAATEWLAAAVLRAGAADR